MGIDIYMNMCIIIIMNIYIKPSREDLLRKYCTEKGVSMSSVIDQALEVFIGKVEWKPNAILKKELIYERLDGPETPEESTGIDSKGDIPFD